MTVAQEIDANRSARLAHRPEDFGGRAGLGVRSRIEAAGGRRPTLALTAEGPRRADLVAWAGTHSATLAAMRLLAPAGIGALLAEHVRLATEPLRSGTVGPAATAGLAAAGDIDAMIAFSDPTELRPGDTTTRSLTRLAVFWDIPIAGNRATADLLLASVTASHTRPPVDLLAPGSGDAASADLEPVRGAVQLWNVRATVDDVPGRLAILAASLARRAINILSVQVHLTPDGPVDELLVAASPVLSSQDLCAAVIDGGARGPRVTPADAHALVDAPTRALTLATRLVRKPDELPTVLAGLLPGASLAWRAEAPEGRDEDPGRLWLADPTGGGFLLTRSVAPFTPAERARAYAMVDVATVVQTRPAKAEPESWRLLLADGTELAMRRATTDDLEAVVELHRRCSMTTRLRRYLAGTRGPSEVALGRMLTPPSGHTLMVEDGTGRVIAMATMIGAGETAELALLVEDAWQNRRLGTLLARRMVAMARADGVTRVRAVVHASNSAMIRIVTALCAEPGHRLHREYDAGMLTLIASLPSLARSW